MLNLLGVVEHGGILSSNCIDQSIGKSKQAAKLRYKVNAGIFMGCTFPSIFSVYLEPPI